ncbi:hypothetical protein D3C87_955080 [compost metagenome]
MVRSPCNKTCTIDRDRMLCIGCWRTLDEIVQWLDMKNEQRLAVIALAERRKALDEVDGGEQPA